MAVCWAAKDNGQPGPCPCNLYRPSPRRTSGAALRKSRETQKRAAKAERLAGGRGRAGPGRADVIRGDDSVEVKSRTIPAWLRSGMAQARRLATGARTPVLRLVDPGDGYVIEIREP